MNELKPLPEVLVPGVTELREARLAKRDEEKSVISQALIAILADRLGPDEAGRSRMARLLDDIREQDGPKAEFDSIAKLLEFVQPKLQRVTVADPDGNPVGMPVIQVSFGGPGMGIVQSVDAEVVDGG